MVMTVMIMISLKPKEDKSRHSNYLHYVLSRFLFPPILLLLAAPKPTEDAILASVH
jgi:hypothetical protein